MPSRSLLHGPSTLAVVGFLLLLSLACDDGLSPPATPPTGTIRGTVTYVDPSAWPPPDSLLDLRFFALPFVPVDTLDFFRDISLLVFSDPLDLFVAADTFLVTQVPARVYVYSGIAQQFSGNLLDRRPVGLYTANGGFFVVQPGETVELSITVDFRNPPPFPPAGTHGAP